MTKTELFQSSPTQRTPEKETTKKDDHNTYQRKNKNKRVTFAPNERLENIIIIPNRGTQRIDNPAQNNHQQNNNKPGKKQRKRKKGSNKKGTLNIFYANANGLRSKMKSLIANSSTQQSDIIMICETKGNPPIMDGYKWHTKNRTSQKGGGVAIAIKTELHKYSSKLDDLEDNNQEVLWVEMNLKRK